jgi:tetratricopeptide (TPR) repeat protein
MENQNAYSALGIHKGATDEEIKKAYVELVKRFDPEKHTDRFMVIQAAYESLRDPAKRAKEDYLLFTPLPGRFLYSPEERTEGSDAEVNQEADDAEQAYGAAPDDGDALVAYIRSLMRRSYKKVTKRLWAEAIEDWKIVLELEPTHQRAKNNLLFSYLQLGYSYGDHGLHEEALDLWEKALHMDPENEALLHDLAIASELTGKNDKGKRYWTEILKRWQERIDADPDDIYTKHLIIEVHRHHGGQSAGEGGDGGGPASVEEYREILKIKPNDFEAQYKIATVLMEEQKWEEAREGLKSLLGQYPRNIEVQNLLGWAYINSGRITEAFQTWTRSLAMDPKNISTREALIKGRLAMGRAFRNKGMYTQSLVHFKALLLSMPKSPEVHMEIGQTYMAKGDKRSATLEYQKVLEMDPKNRDAKQHLSDMKLRS